VLLFQDKKCVVKFFYFLRYVIFVAALFFAQTIFAQTNTNEILCPGGEVILSTSNDSATTYQWQENRGSGFTDITEGGNYSGPTGFSMQLLNLPSAWYGYQYRCVVDGIPENNIYTLQFATQWLNFTDNWSNPKNWSCGKVPDATIDVVIGYGGEVIVDVNAICRSLTVYTNASVRIDPGVNLTIVH
jgi:hypothetical protein